MKPSNSWSTEGMQMYNHFTREVRKDRAQSEEFNTILLGIIQNRRETSNSNKKMRHAKQEEVSFIMPADDMHLLDGAKTDEDEDKISNNTEDEEADDLVSNGVMVDDNNGIDKFD